MMQKQIDRVACLWLKVGCQKLKYHLSLKTTNETTHANMPSSQLTINCVLLIITWCHLWIQQNTWKEIQVPTNT